MKSIVVLHGPNLNLLGHREPQIYGNMRLTEINQQLCSHAEKLGYRCACYQTNAEHLFINHIHNAYENQIDGMLINAGAFTHTSIAIRDALICCAIPFIEVHLSNLAKRESFRHNSYLADIAVGSIMGFKAQSYHLALLAMHDYLE